MLRLKFLWLVVVLLFVNNTYAVLELEITQSADDAMPITILPFTGQEVLGVDDNTVISVISNDLKNSGRFRLVDVAGSSAEAVDYAVWKARKVAALVTGQVKPLGGDQFIITLRIFAIYSKSELLIKEYRVSKAQLRILAHHLSDIIYQQLFGERGVFSTKIAYVLVEREARRISKYRLQVADSDGHNTHTLLTSSFPLMSPAWSPDGKKIAYVSFEGNRAAIYLQDLATGSRELVSKFPGINGAPAWSPDGKKMALVLTPTGYPKIYILDLATKNAERITDGWYLDTEPHWAPDGKSIIFTSNRGGGPQIYSINLENKNIVRLTFNGTYNARASFIPNVNGLVMLHKEGEMFTIASEDLQTKRLTLLTRAGLHESPSIAPNGKMVVYATNHGGRGMLAEVSIDGRVKLLLPAGYGEVQEPAWSPFLN